MKSGLNRYQYCGSNPVTYVDPLGLEPILSKYSDEFFFAKMEDSGNKGKDYIEYIEKIGQKEGRDVYNHNLSMFLEIDEINSEYDDIVNAFEETYLKYEAVYRELADKSGIPPQLIAIIHYRENSTDFFDGTFNVYLHNGEPLGEPTKKNPAGKYFDNFTDATLDALSIENTFIKSYGLTADSKDIVAMMSIAELYNGLGYYYRNQVNPYLYSGTNVYKSGKFVEEPDGKGGYKPTYREDLVDKQVGVYLLLRATVK